MDSKVNFIYSLDFNIIEKCIKYQMKYYKIQSDLFEDIFQDTVLILLEYNVGKLKDIIYKGKFNAFVTKILKNQLNSTTSAFYKTYKKPIGIPLDQLIPYTDIEDEPYEEPRIPDKEDIKEKITHNEGVILDIFIQNKGRYNRTASALGCSIPTLRRYIKRIKSKC